MDSKIDGLMVVEALQRSSLIETKVPTDEIAAAVMAGVVVIVKGAFDPQEMRHLRTAIISAKLPFCELSFSDARSWRNRREVIVSDEIDILYEASYLAVRRPEDEVGRAVRPTTERLAGYWRSLTGYKHTFLPQPDRHALRPFAVYYPAGGGCFGWHSHNIQPTKIGLILALSETGVDFLSGGNEFETPYGLVNSMSHHDIGDICLFRYDLRHRVTPVDSDRELCWDGSGRWTLLVQGDSRPREQTTA